MADQTERTPRRGVSFPFLLTLILFVAVMADLWLSEPGFLASAAWRQQPLIAIGMVVLGLLLWLWVLAAARRRSRRFEGPIEVARGTNGALQPLLATVFIVVGLNIAYGQTLPKWLNAVAAERVESETFIVAGEVAEPRAGCSRALATSERFGEVTLCLPARIADALREADEAAIAVSGPASWFGLEPQRYALPQEQPIVPAELVLGPAGQGAPSNGGQESGDDHGAGPSIDELFEQIFGSGEERQAPSSKTGRR